MAETSLPLLNGRYQLLEVLGEGGMAVVWRAEDTLLRRTVAAKVLRSQFAADPEFVERFRSEARAAAALNDPGIVGVYDVGADDGRHYLVMEYVPGRDLKTIIRDEAPLAPERAVGISTALARAVAAAHAIGLVHRDIKPQNVLVTPDGRMKVADFGIARAVAAGGMTAPGIVLGTVHYIAPEQAAGGTATPMSDVYSLGVVLYEMLTGRVPFDADSTVGVAIKILNEEPEPVDAVNPRVPAVLAGIVAKAMARQPEDRHPDAGAMAAALENFARWSQQATAGFQPAAAATAAAARGVATGPAAPAAGERDGPLLDWTGLLLAVIAALALAGLIPLWLQVLQTRGAVGAPLAPAGPHAPADASQLPSAESAAGSTSLPAAQVPDVVGVAVAEAQATLAAQGLGVSTDFGDAPGVPDGQVIAQSRQPGAAAVAGDVVRLTVSGRDIRVAVPDLAGLDFGSAAASLEQLGFIPRYQEVWSGADAGGANTVIGLDPPPGTYWFPGQEVTAQVSSGGWKSLGVTFADGLYLRGVNLMRNTFAPGESVAVSPVWEAVGEVERDYGARAVLLDANGNVVAQDEKNPVRSDQPTSGWAPGTQVDGDGFNLPLDPALPGGSYNLYLDLYWRDDPNSLLEIVNAGLARVEGSRVLVMPITVGP